MAITTNSNWTEVLRPGHRFRLPGQRLRLRPHQRRGAEPGRGAAAGAGWRQGQWPRRGAEGGKGWKLGDERVVFLGKMVENGGFTQKNGGKWWFYQEKWWNMVVLPWFTEKFHGISWDFIGWNGMRLDSSNSFWSHILHFFNNDNGI